MRLLNKIDEQPDQRFNLIGESGEAIDFRVYYMPSQQSWFFDMAYNGQTLNGTRICVSPNLIRSHKNVLPFGLACMTTDGAEPFYIDDFKNDRIRLYLLNANEVAQVEEAFFDV